MSPDDIKKLIAQKLPDCDIDVEGGSGKFHISIVGDVFAGLNPVKRQQMIYQMVDSEIQSGAIHAVTMHLQTIAEMSS